MVNGIAMKLIMRFFLFFCCVLSGAVMDAQQVIKLWEDAPPQSNELTGEEIVRNNGAFISNVSVPALTVYLPEKNNRTGMAVVICPGGGYSGLAFDHEGIMVANWLNKEGIAAFILKYRMPNKHKEIPLSDAQQAIRYVRTHAAEYDVITSKIGVCGFSAGGHLASTVSTHFTTSGVSSRPDFSILYYPVITMTEATHGGSRTNLLVDNPSQTDIYMFSNEKQVNVNTPPAILFLSDDDKAVIPMNSIMYYESLKKNEIPAAMYIFPTGGHGWGFRTDYSYYEQMTVLLSAWLKSIN